MPLAHAGHWLVNVLYIVPVVVLIGALAWQRRRDRRHPRPDEDAALQDRDS